MAMRIRYKRSIAKFTVKRSDDLNAITKTKAIHIKTKLPKHRRF